jgi:hypothetical protein
VRAHQCIDRFGSQEWNIAIQHQQLTLKTLEGRQQLLDGMARSVLRLLQHKFEPTIGAQLSFHTLSLMANNQKSAFWSEITSTREHTFHQGGSR